MYFSNIDYTYNYIWIDAVKEENESTWYWETNSGHPKPINISDFHWGKGHPTMNGTLVRTCIKFNYDNGVYEYNDCAAKYYLNVICEPSKYPDDETTTRTSSTSLLKK